MKEKIRIPSFTPSTEETEGILRNFGARTLGFYPAVLKLLALIADRMLLLVERDEK